MFGWKHVPDADNDVAVRIFAVDSIGGAAANDDDYIDGGTGIDIMTGGGGADTFAYNSNADSGTGASNRDQITDFSQSEEDQIDLSAFTGTFDFIGTSSFSGTANEVRYSIDAGNNRTIVYVDSDGDSATDFEIELTGQITLVGGDFIL